VKGEGRLALQMVTRRAAPLVLLLTLALALVTTAWGSLAAALTLTVTAAIGILSTSFLEGALVRILQPGRPRMTQSAVLMLLGHLALWGIFLAVVYWWRQQVEMWAVAAGIGCFVLGLSLGGMQIGGGSSAREE
jgi:hypothetical protein